MNKEHQHTLSNSKSSVMVDELRYLENDPDCSIVCENGGKCISTDSFLHKVNHPLDEISVPQFRCICKPGFEGRNCEEVADPCGEPGKFCQNGASCITMPDAEGILQDICDCSTAFEESNFAGDTCEYAATVNCEVEVDKIGDVEEDPDIVETRAFCVNEGICVHLIEPGKAHHGCNCMKGFEGSFCEFPYESSFGTDLFSKSPASPLVTETIMISIIALLAITAIYGIVVLRRYFVFRNEERMMMVSALNATDELQMTVGRDSTHGDMNDFGEFVIDDDEDNITPARKKKGKKYTSVSGTNEDIRPGEII
mmetsp:Transcript_30654/g.45083  ORF Transcript_30654/g.45083 Transcript_30654/m.45083 type:complete len:311 (+) Transcript_30654:2-934(+)